MRQKRGGHGETGRDGWMVAPRRLPLSFSGKQEGGRAFIVGSVQSL